MTSLKTVSMAMLVAITAICAQADAQIYYPQPVQQQYIPAQPMYQPMYQPMPAGQPVQNFQGSFQPYSGVPFDPNDPSTFHGETSETAQEATAQRPWDPSQGYQNDDVVIAIEEDDTTGMVVFRYPAGAEAPLSYSINEQGGTLAPGTNLKIPSGDEFKFTFVPAAGKEAMAHDITTDGNYSFEAGSNGWKVVDYVAPQDDPAVKKMMMEKEAAAQKKKEMMEKEAAEKKAMMEKEAAEKKEAMMEKEAAEKKEAMMEKEAAAKKEAMMTEGAAMAEEEAAAKKAAMRAQKKAERAAARARKQAEGSAAKE